MLINPLPNLVSYEEALHLQEQAVADVLAGGPERAFFLEHPPCFTTGTGAHPSELLNTGNIPVIPTGRGGKTTYHGPGQRVVYIIKDLRQTRDLRAYIQSLQNWLIASLSDLGGESFTTDDVGVWVNTQKPAEDFHIGEANLSLARRSLGVGGQAKVAAIGVRVRKWVAFHGIALNVNPDLSTYNRIIPCGLAKPVTSLHALGLPLSMEDVDKTLIANLHHLVL